MRRIGPHFQRLHSLSRSRVAARCRCDLPNGIVYISAQTLVNSATMPKHGSKEVPTKLAPRPFEDGSGWYVEAQWVERDTERLGRFATYAEAREWIALESAIYFVLRELWR